MYMADNVAFFPYAAADEPLFVIHNIDIIVSVAGSNILQSFREVIAWVVLSDVYVWTLSESRVGLNVSR